MIHLDLFSGIGGFAHAADQVFSDVEHIFVEFDPFCQQVLAKHWPESEIYGDIRQFTTYPTSKGRTRKGDKAEGQSRQFNRTQRNQKPFLLTGGFPCQPFSAAGLRKGTADDRHLWPEMLRVIRLTQPEWVIAENVRGLLTWNEGLVFEQVCADLEAEGYEVQPFIIPAVAVNAPHRRDRVWFVAKHTERRDGRGESASQGTSQVSEPADKRTGDATNPSSDRRQRRGSQAPAEEGHTTRPELGGQLPSRPQGQDSWDRNWTEVAAKLCSVDDGLPVELDGLKLSKPQHRKEQLKAYGNAIVPQVAIEIMKGMR